MSGPRGKKSQAGGAAALKKLPIPPILQPAVDQHRLREQDFSPEDVLALWQKAVEAAQDAVLPQLSIDGALTQAYNAGHLGALALLAARGLRTGGGMGHHEMAFYGAAHLGYDGLADLVPDSEEIRRLRKGSMYDPVIAGEAERRDAVAWMCATLPPLRAALAKALPAPVAARLAPFP